MSMPELYQIRPDFPRPDDVKLTVPKVAEILGISITSVHRLIQSGELQAYQIGRVIRVLERHLVEFFDAEQRKPMGGWAKSTGTRQGSPK